MPGERIGPAPEDDSLKGWITNLRNQLFGDPYEQKVDAPTELAASQSNEFLNRNRSVLDIINNTPGVGLPTPSDAGGLSRAVAAVRPDQAREMGRLVSEIAKTSHDIPVGTRKAIAYIQQKYPRLFGHVQELHVDPVATRNTGSQLSMATTRQVRGERLMDPSDFRTSAVQIGPGTAKQDVNTLAHELSHVMDQLRLGSRHAGEYEAASKRGILRFLPQDLAEFFNKNERRARATGNKVEKDFAKAERAGIVRKPERRANRAEDRIPDDWAERVAAVDRSRPTFSGNAKDLRAQLEATMGTRYDPEAVWQAHMPEMSLGELLELLKRHGGQ